MVIVAVVLLLLGPDKLPDVAQKLGSSWRALKRIQERVEAEVREAIPDLPSSGDIARIARSPVNLLNQLADRVDAKEEITQPSLDGTLLAREGRGPVNEPLFPRPASVSPMSDPSTTSVPPPDPSLN